MFTKRNRIISEHEVVYNSCGWHKSLSICRICIRTVFDENIRNIKSTETHASDRFGKRVGRRRGNVNCSRRVFCCGFIVGDTRENANANIDIRRWLPPRAVFTAVDRITRVIRRALFRLNPVVMCNIYSTLSGEEARNARDRIRLRSMCVYMYRTI